jgi:autotransporter-associated beta strand protein
VTYTVNNAINSATATDLVYCDNVQTMTNNCFAYALWLRNSSTTSITNNSGGPYLLTLGSGGLSASHSATHVSTISPNLKFGTTGEKEALIFAGRDYYHGTLILQGSLTTTNGLTKSGFGTLKLEGDSSATLSGPVTINSGILQLNHANALPSGLSMNLQAGLRRSLLTGNNIPLSGGNLDLYGNNLTVADLTLADQTWVRNSAATTTSTLTVNGDITVNGNEYVATIAPDAGASLTLALGSANRTFQVVNASDDLDLSISAVVTGTGGLTKTGPGRMELRTNNTFSGSIIVKEGTLTSQSLGATSLCSPLGNSANAINLTNSATLMFAATTAGILHGAQTSVGRVSVAGGNVITFANNYNSKTTNTFAALERAGSTRGTLLFQGGNNGSLRDYPGLCVFIYLTETPTITNGMLPPWIAGRTTRNAILASAEPEFLTYDATLGIKSVAYDVNNNFGTAVQKVNLYTAPINVTANKSMWALRTSVNITQSGGAWTLAIGSGGLLFGGGVVSIAPSVQFGATGTDEAVIFVDTGTAGMLSNTVVTTGGLTKFGAGTLSLAAASTAFSGPVYVQAGILALGHNSALGTGSDTIYLQSGARLDYYVNGTLTRPVVGVGSITTGTNLLTVAATGSLTPAAGEIGTMYVEDVDFRGTYNWEYNEAGSDLIKAVNLTFGGSPTLNVTWLGGGNAPLGEYEVFRYVGAAPSLAGWTVATPSGQQGTLTLDTTNKRVLLTLSNSTSGTLLIFR